MIVICQLFVITSNLFTIFYWKCNFNHEMCNWKIYFIYRKIWHISNGNKNKKRRTQTEESKERNRRDDNEIQLCPADGYRSIPLIFLSFFLWLLLYNGLAAIHLLPNHVFLIFFFSVSLMWIAWIHEYEKNFFYT